MESGEEWRTKLGVGDFHTNETGMAVDSHRGVNLGVLRISGVHMGVSSENSNQSILLFAAQNFPGRKLYRVKTYF